MIRTSLRRAPLVVLLVVMSSGCEGDEFRPSAAAGAGGVAGRGGQTATGGVGGDESGGGGSSAGQAGAGDAGGAGAGAFAGTGVGGEAGAGGVAGTGGVAGEGGSAGNGGAAGSAQGGAGSGGFGGGAVSDCSALHVSTTGDDAAGTGCSGSPFRTIGKALLSAEVGMKEVRVCAGKYEERVRVLGSVRITGSFDCATWQTIADAPTFEVAKADAVLTTRIVNPATAVVGNDDPALNTLTMVAGASLVLRGVVVRGHVLPGGASRAIDAEVGASIKIERSVIEGGAGKVAGLSAPPGSTGLRLGAGVLGSLTETLVQGGSGVSDRTIGSVGVVVRAAPGVVPPVVFDRVVLEGGSGRGKGEFVAEDTNAASNALGSIGVYALRSIDVRKSVVRGGDGAVHVGQSSIGILAGNPAPGPTPLVIVTDSLVDGGRGTTLALEKRMIHAQTIGVYLTRADARIERSRLYGGDGVTEKPLPPQELVGMYTAAVLAQGGGDVRLIDNFIVGGNQGKRPLSGPARGVIVFAPNTGTLVHNTIHAGSTTTSNAVAVYLAPAAKLARFENNILAASSTSPDGSYTFRLDGCPSGRFTTFDGNLFLPSTSGVMSRGSGSGCFAEAGPYQQLGALVTAGIIAKVGANVRASEACGQNELACVPTPGCGSPEACTKLFFLVDPTLQHLEAGFPKVSTTLPCATIRASPLSADVQVDGMGVLRTAPVSAGAIERDQCQ